MTSRGRNHQGAILDQIWEFLALLETYPEAVEEAALHDSESGRIAILHVYVERMSTVLQADVAFVAIGSGSDGAYQLVVDQKSLCGRRSPATRSRLDGRLDTLHGKLAVADVAALDSGGRPFLALDPDRVARVFPSLSGAVVSMAVARVDLSGHAYFLCFCDTKKRRAKLPRYYGYAKTMLSVVTGILEISFRAGRQDQASDAERDGRAFILALASELKPDVDALSQFGRSLGAAESLHLEDLGARIKEISARLQVTVDSLRMTPSIGAGLGSRVEAFEDFDLRVTGALEVSASSLEGETDEIPIGALSPDIKTICKDIDGNRTSEAELKKLGSLLYQLLLPSEIHAHLLRTEAAARARNKSIRVRLWIEPDDLAVLPWEFLYRADLGYFFAVNPATVLSRYLRVGQPVNREPADARPPHLLAIVSDPTDQPKLYPETWKELLATALSGLVDRGRLTMEMVPRATQSEITAAIVRKAPDIVQFVGHGTYDRGDGRGYLALVEDDGTTWRLDDRSFADMFLTAGRTLRLVSLATCESATSDSPQSFRGIAHQLVERGIPAVVAMQYSVLVKTAEVFLQNFYVPISEGKPVDWAVQSGRNAIALKLGYGNREFGTPVLYMRGQDGELLAAGSR